MPAPSCAPSTVRSDCVATRADGVVRLRAFPSLRPLAGEPRYEQLLRTLKLDRFGQG